MAKITPIRKTEQFEHFVAELKDSFWGDVCGQTGLCLKKWLELDSLQQRDEYVRQEPQPKQAKRYRNGAAQLLLISSTPMEETKDHQCD
jgi:hypothetical protein